MSTSITIREATGADGVSLRRLAALDSSPPQPGPALVATVGGDIRAAMARDGSWVLADPFFRCAEVVELLRVRSLQLPGASRPHSAAA